MAKIENHCLNFTSCKCVMKAFWKLIAFDSCKICLRTPADLQLATFPRSSHNVCYAYVCVQISLNGEVTPVTVGHGLKTESLDDHFYKALSFSKGSIDGDVKTTFLLCKVSLM